jgi:hypothetical protein
VEEANIRMEIEDLLYIALVEVEEEALNARFASFHIDHHSRPGFNLAAPLSISPCSYHHHAHLP